MSSLRPQSHRYHFPNQVTKLALKPLQRGRADGYQQGILPAIWLRFLLPASAAGTSEVPLSPFRVPPSPECLMPENETHQSKRGTIGGREVQQ